MVKFDEATHTYTLHGRRLVSVTQIIGHYLQPVAGIPEKTLKAAGAFGTAVHLMCEYYLLGTLDMYTLDAGLLPYLRGFMKFVRDMNLNDDKLAIEKIVSSARLGLAGKPDIIITGGAIIDIKTRAYSRNTDPLQLAAYDKLSGGNGNTFPHLVVEIIPDDYVMTKCNDRQAWPLFSRMLKHYHDTQKIETYITGWKARR